MSSSGSTRAAGTPSSGGNAAAAPSQDGQQQGGNDWRKTVLKSLLMYFAMQALVGPNGLVKWYQGKTSIQTDSGAGTARVDDTLGQRSSGQQSMTQPALAQAKVKVPLGATSIALFDPHEPLDVHVLITAADAPTTEDLTTQQSRLVPGGTSAGQSTLRQLLDDVVSQHSSNPSAEVKPVVWTPTTARDALIGAVSWNGIRIGDAGSLKDVDLDIRVPEHVRSSNGSIWAEIFVGPAGHAASGPHTVHVRKLLTRLFPERKERVEKKLFDKRETDDVKHQSSRSSLPFIDREPSRLVTWWHNNLTLAVVEQGAGIGLPIANMPPPLLQHVHVRENEEGEAIVPTPKTVMNYPVVFPNDFWHLREHMHTINETHATLPLHVSLYSTSFFKFQLLAAMSDSFDKSPGMAANEVDMIKLTLLENSPWYLGLTIGVSILHSLFEFLAFSSDVSHWRNKDNMAGVSLGSILTNVIVQLIILLYLLDQAQETSWMILASQAVGIVIEAWKLTKAVTVGVVARKAGEGLRFLQWLPYRIEIRDKHVLTEEERKTQQFDKLAFRIVSMVAIPLLGAYTVYSALYQTHKGWWSFVIGTLCSFVYAFGFVSLIPQLIVNYKLKSTAGMNSKTFVYKILGTFVDDLFAFAIRQPLLHRLACFRDDIVFLVFLYQRWKYGVDPTRVNEYGQVLEKKKGESEESKKDQ